MARIRTIKPEFWTDDKIISLPFAARLFFIGLWNFADDYGCLQDKPEQLKLLVLPSEESFEVHQILDLLIASDLIERFIDDDTDSTFLVVKNWSIHQKVDKPARSRILKANAKKATIPLWVRRKVAEKYDCVPGKTKQCECYFCGTKGSIYWPVKKNGEPSSWVCFSHELSHFIPEVNNGPTEDFNIVLACRNCNRSMGAKHAFDWLFMGVYKTNQYSPNIEKFREASRLFANTIDGKEGKGKDSKGKETVGETPNGVGEVKTSPLDIPELYVKLEKNKKAICDFIKEHRPGFIEPYVELWNLFATEKGLAKVSKISDPRKRKFKVRIAEKAFDFLEILKKAGQSEFLLTGKWFGFDWILENESNYLKIIEGNYDKKSLEDASKKTAASLTDLQYLYERFLDGALNKKLVKADHYDLISDVFPLTIQLKEEAQKRRIQQLTSSNQATDLRLLEDYQKEARSVQIKADEATIIRIAKKMALMEYFQVLKTNHSKTVKDGIKSSSAIAV